MRGLSPIALACLTVAGCAQLAGLDETSGDGRTGVSLTIERASIGATVIHAPQDLSANTATYLATSPDDPLVITPIVAEQTETGVWTADIFQQTPPVLFDLPDQTDPPLQRLFDVPNADLRSNFDVFEHPGATTIDPTSTLTVNVALDRAQAAETYELFVVGTWTQVALTAPALGATVLAPAAFEVSTMSALTGRPIEAITMADVAVIVRRNGPVVDGLVELAAFDQNGADQLTGTLSAVAADQTLDFTVDPVDATNRFTAVRPSVGTPTFGWNVRAAPGAERAQSLGPVLDSGAVLMTDTAVQTAFGNPFAASHNWPAVLDFNASASRSTMPDGVTPVTLSAGMIQRVQEPAAGTAIDLPAGLPQLISIDGRALSIDNDVTISAPTAPVEVTIVTDRADATATTLDVVKLVNDGMGAYQRVRVLTAFSVSGTFHIPPEAFEPGNVYTLRVQTVVGSFPNIATGDLSTRDLPLSIAFLDSAVFQVMP